MTAVIQVAEHGTFAAAAKVLEMSTSAISKAIARLEDDLNVKLFHRTTRSVSLTPEGERFVLGIKPLLMEIDALSMEVSDYRAAPKGLLRISAPDAFARNVLAPSLSQFRTLYPDIQVDLSLDDRDVDLAGEPIDVAIRTGALPDNATLVARKLYSDPLITCAAPAYLNSNDIPKHPQDLAKHNCLPFRNRRTGRTVPWLFADDVRMNPSGGPRINDIEAVCRVAVAGVGITQLPGHLAAGLIKTGMLQEILDTHRPPDVPVSAIYLNRRFVSPRIRSFIDFMLTVKLPMPSA